MEIVVPDLGESIVEATIARWLKKEGDPVSVGEPVVALETDKVDLEVGAKQDGVLTSIAHQEGEDVKVGEVLGTIEVGEAAKPSKGEQPAPKESETAKPPSQTKNEAVPEKQVEAKPAEPTIAAAEKTRSEREDGAAERATPVARRLAEEQGIDIARIKPSGPGERVTKEDVQRYMEQQTPAPAGTKEEEKQPAQTSVKEPPAAQPQPQAAPTLATRKPAEQAAGISPAATSTGDGRREERVRMSRRRRTIAARLVEAKQTTAMLTTFNDVDMSAVIEVRTRRKESFQKRHGIKLGFMSFFVKASVGALKEFPDVNAEIQGDEIVYKRYYDIGMAIGAEEGLVVPVLRNADRMSFAQIEKTIQDFIDKSREGTLTLDDLRGGTFTITNGGVFGSLLSTPILNPPQVGILGLHRIEDRPVAIDGQVAIRPMMYLALSYDHRIVDGREAVQFLVRIKELIEDPETLLLEG